MISHSALFGAVGLSLSCAGAAEAACRIALLLAVDVSSSVSDAEYTLQQKGLARALISEDVMHAILETQAGHVAFSMFEWSGRYQQNIVVDWTIFDSQEDVFAVAQQIANSKRQYFEFPTAMGFSLGYGAGLLKQAPPCDRRVMDVSGDGINNDGFGPQTAYRHFPFQDVTVNGLVISESDPNVQLFYQTEVLKGRQAFLEIANGFEDFERAMTRKLTRELEGLILSSIDR
ncbi:DUF1194 domain-containing protein [Planktotalea sp.]|uniref:DUF1194 domain-containing protein n=1 Tax=Planktotalea sp. TaxID=2029877 RepID=UPI00329A59F5